MCVIIAAKIEGKGWILAKNRDRNYVPHIHFKKQKKNGKLDYGVFVDKDTMWTEGVNSVGIAIVNTALMVVKDEKFGKASKKAGPKVTDQGDVMLKALAMTDIMEVVEYISDVKGLLGFTFITDGDRLFVLENARRWESGEDFKDDDEKALIGHSLHWFEVLDPEIDLMVRTNHGEIFNDLGYTIDSDGGKSSRMRRKYVEDYLKKNPPKRLRDLFKALSQTENKDPNLNPLRTPDCDLFTTGQIGILPKDKKLFYRPVKCKVIVKGNEVDPNEIRKRSRDDIDIYVVKTVDEIGDLAEMSFKKYYETTYIQRI